MSSAMEDDTETFSIESCSYRFSITEAQDGSFRAYLETSNQNQSTPPKTQSNDTQDFNFPTKTLFHLDLSHSPPSKSVSSSPRNIPIYSNSSIKQSFQSRHCKCFKGCWRNSIRCVREYLGWLRPSINGCTGSRVKTEQKQMSGVYCCADRADYENSIIEAVIYCKQSWKK
ncbi:hypothetical protein Syun_013289 [Stephania yunnanensis]|uniref:Uncharacterized protein n=1 Tax=Stephania yunnanensis TaxID=152371 RepID=A0AAP0PIG1_9MAGN